MAYTISPEPCLLLSLNDLSNIKGFIAAHINVHSLFPKIEFLRHELSALPIDVICITETWLRPANPDSMIAVPGYRLERLDRVSDNPAVKQTGGGLVIYIRNSINYITHLPYSTISPSICPTYDLSLIL